MTVSVVGLLCRTSDRTPGGARGAAALSELLGDRVSVPARMVGTPRDPHEASWQDDLREHRGCILEAGGQVEDALAAGSFPILCAAECTICLTTLPTVARCVPGARVLWLDAHGDFNTPQTTPSGYLGGMCLAGACGRWDSGFEGRLDPADVVLVGSRDLDAGERAELDLAGVARVERFSQVADAVDGAPVYVHVDLDVLDPDLFPAQFPASGGLSDAGLGRLLDEVAQAADRIVGVEITAFEAPADAIERERLTAIAADAVMPLLPVAV
ncbi:MAG: arginase [Solirubrobacteraceae bacterium]|jgi:arginase family enzyme|nr:arginase [Solirubrobacteraceae bacterium]